MITMSSSVFRGSHLVVQVVLHGRSFPADAEWQLFCEERSALRAELAGTDRRRALIISDGGAPTSKQRVVLRPAVQDAPAKTALVTASRLALGIGTGLGLVNSALKTFAPKDYLKAIRYLEIPEDEWPLLADHLDVARSHMQVEILDVIRTRSLRVAR